MKKRLLIFTVILTLLCGTLVAYQASPRGGTLYCTQEGARIKMSGKAAIFSVADINVG